MKRKLRIYALPLILMAMSITLQLVSNSETFDSFIASVFVAEKVETIKRLITDIGFVVFVVPIGWQAVTRGKKADVCDATVAKYINEQRSLVAQVLQNEKYVVNCTQEDINIRVFKRKFNRLVLENEDRFYSRRIEGKLSFNISKQEGLCAKAFSKKCSMLETEDASKTEYNLTQRQQALAGSLKFIVAVPILHDGSGKIKYVICFDSFQKIAKAGCEQGILKRCETIAYTIGSLLE